MNKKAETLFDAPITVVLGQRGSGKTCWVKKQLPTLPRFILWNTVNDDYAGFEVVNDKHDLFDFVWRKRNGICQVIVNYLPEEKGEQDEEEEGFAFTCRLAEAVENICLIIEEVDTYATTQAMPFELKKLLKLGRHFGVSMVMISRRPAEINRLITSQAQRFVCFRTIEPNDIRYLISIIGESAKELPAIPMLHYLDWRHGVIEKGEIQF